MVNISIGRIKPILSAMMRMSVGSLLTTALVGGIVTSAIAAPEPTISVLAVQPHGVIQLEFNNLPANDTFEVLMGAAGTNGVGGELVANFDTGNGGTLVSGWFEIQSDVRLNGKVDVRIQDSNGISAFTSFDNTTTIPAVITPTPLPIPVTGGAGGPIVVESASTIHVLSVEQGGIVIVMITNLPASTDFTVSIGDAGTKGILTQGGYQVAHLKTEDLSSKVAIATFEIPTLVRADSSLDLRIEAPGYLYLTTFNNVNQ